MWLSEDDFEAEMKRPDLIAGQNSKLDPSDTFAVTTFWSRKKGCKVRRKIWDEECHLEQAVDALSLKNTGEQRHKVSFGTLAEDPRIKDKCVVPRSMAKIFWRHGLGDSENRSPDGRSPRLKQP